MTPRIGLGLLAALAALGAACGDERGVVVAASVIALPDASIPADAQAPDASTSSLSGVEQGLVGRYLWEHVPLNGPPPPGPWPAFTWLHLRDDRTYTAYDWKGGGGGPRWGTWRADVAATVGKPHIELTQMGYDGSVHVLIVEGQSSTALEVAEVTGERATYDVATTIAFPSISYVLNHLPQPVDGICLDAADCLSPTACESGFDVTGPGRAAEALCVR